MLVNAVSDALRLDILAPTETLLWKNRPEPGSPIASPMIVIGAFSLLFPAIMFDLCCGT